MDLYECVFVYMCKDYLNFSLNHKPELCNGMFTTKILCIFHVYAQSRINRISLSKKDIKCYLKWNKITETDVIFYFPGVCVCVCVCLCVYVFVTHYQGVFSIHYLRNILPAYACFFSFKNKWFKMFYFSFLKK